MGECIFCRIARKELEAQVVYEDDRAIAFRDIRPQAPVHVLVIPKEHIVDIREAGEEILGHLARVAVEVARREGVSESGFRVVVNCGPDSGAEVPHLHFHVLGGRKMGWPPG